MIKRLGLALVLASTVANATPIFSANLLALTHVKSTYSCRNPGIACFIGHRQCCKDLVCLPALGSFFGVCGYK